MRVWCEVCGREVDYFEKAESHAGDEIIYTARCHGDTETTRITVQNLANCGPIKFVEGRAFANKRLKKLERVYL